MKNLTNRYIAYLSIGIFALLVAIGSATYALFFRTATQGSTNTFSTLNCVDLSFQGNSDSITVSAGYPLTEAEGLLNPFNFTVSNNCDNYVEYQIIATLTTASNIPQKYLKVALNGDKTVSQRLINTLTITDTPVGIGSSYQSSSYVLAGNTFSNQESHTYDFNLWLDGDNELIWDASDISANQSVKIKLSIVGVVKTKPDEPEIANNCRGTIGIPESVYKPIQVGDNAFAKLEQNGDIRVYGSGAVWDGTPLMITIPHMILAQYFGGYYNNPLVFFVAGMEATGSEGIIQELFDEIEAAGYFETLPTQEELLTIFYPIIDRRIGEMKDDASHVGGIGGGIARAVAEFFEDSFANLDLSLTPEQIEFLLCQLGFIVDDNTFEKISNAIAEGQLANDLSESPLKPLIPGLTFSGNLIIEEGITEIGEYMFSFSFFAGMEGLFRSVALPNSLTKIKTGAFGLQLQLETIVIPANVVIIEDGAFTDSNSLTNVTILGSNPQRFNANWSNIGFGNATMP